MAGCSRTQRDASGRIGLQRGYSAMHRAAAGMQRGCIGLQRGCGTAASVARHAGSSTPADAQQAIRLQLKRTGALTSGSLPVLLAQRLHPSEHSRPLREGRDRRRTRGTRAERAAMSGERISWWVGDGVGRVLGVEEESWWVGEGSLWVRKEKAGGWGRKLLYWVGRGRWWAEGGRFD